MKTHPIKSMIGAIALVAFAATVSPARAQLSGELGILDLAANDGLNPATGEPWAQGDTYHLLYVTTGTTDATSTDIADYNAFVQADATTNGMGTVSWFALGSTTSTNAVDNVTITGPVMNAFNSATIAIDAADMWNFLFTNGRTDLDGNLRNVWTGSTGGGVADGKNELGAAGNSTRRHWSGWTDWIQANNNQPSNSQQYMMGISQELTISGPETSFQLIIMPAEPPATGFDLEWESQAGKLYNLRTSTVLTSDITTWELVEGDIEATQPTNNYNVAKDGPRRFYAVEEFDAPPPPPIFATDFEADNGGFTVTTVGGTAWQYGAPDSPTQGGGAVTGGNGGSANAWGTNLTGAYVADTDTSLRSPVIDLTAVTGAELSFAQSIDAPAGHTLEVNVIDDATDTIIANIIPATEDADVNSSAWKAIGPVAIPAEALGQSVRIEWRFTGIFVGTAYNGAYIDDVVVAPNP